MGRMFLSLLVIAVIRKCQSTVVTANTSEELQSAIEKASAGDKIELLPQAYYGNFVLGKLPKDATVTIFGAPTNATAPNSTILSPIAGKSESTAFLVEGSNWIIRNMAIQDFAVGVHLVGSRNSLISLLISNCQNGIKIDGRGSKVTSSTIESSSDAIIISGEDVYLRSNVISGNKTSVTILKSVKSGDLLSNVFYGPVIISGKDMTFTSNVANEGLVLITGSGNSFKANAFNPVNITNGKNRDDGGNTFEYVEGSKEIQSKFGRFANFMGKK